MPKALNPEIAKSRQDARERNLDLYLSEHICSSGHIPTIRYTNSKFCKACKCEKSRKVYEEKRHDPGWIEKRNERGRIYNLTPQQIQRKNEASDEWRKQNRHLHAARFKRREAAKLCRTPPWVDHGAIEQVYLRSRELTAATGVGHQVDHIVPLQGRYVSGLHVQSNLQVLTALENKIKGRKFDMNDLNQCIDLSAEYYTTGWIPVKS